MQRRSALLAELVRCAGCGRSLIPRPGWYACKGKHAVGQCPSPSVIDAGSLEQFVVSELFAALDGDPTAEGIVDAPDISPLLTAVEEAERELIAYRDSNLVSVIGTAAYTDGLRVRQVRADDVRETLDAAREHTAMGRLATETVGLRETWDEMPVEDRRSILAAGIDCVVVRRTRDTGRRLPVDERARIFWRGEGPAGLPSRGRSTPLLDLGYLFSTLDEGVVPAS